MIMLTGAANPTLPRDTMFAILMIVLNGLVGTTLVIGALRHGQQHYNLQGAIAFLAVIVPLAVLTLVLPAFTQSTDDPTFIEPEQSSSHARATKTARRHDPEGKSAFHHVLLLFAALLPVVLLSKPLAKILDYGIEQAGMPTALGGIFIPFWSSRRKALRPSRRPWPITSSARSISVSVRRYRRSGSRCRSFSPSAW
jgi:Ca2+:H+ antiporter